MKIHRLAINGFGRFHTPAQFDFNPEGVTVIVGDNERGKTTIKDAICATLFGFQTTDEKKRYRPWDLPSEYSAAVTFSSKGGVYCIERDFETDRVTVWDVSEHSPTLLFEGTANPRGSSPDREAYYDFVREHMGFISSDIFRLTTLVEQMRTRTEISHKIRQLISGTEKADYIKIAQSLESELETITKDIPWRKKKRKNGQMEDVAADIRNFEHLIEKAQDSMAELFLTEKKIQTLKDDMSELEKELHAGKTTLKALGEYVMLSQEISRIQISLRLLDGQSHTIQDFKKKIDDLESRKALLGTLAPVAIAIVGVSVAVLLQLTLQNPVLSLTALLSGMGLSAATYYFLTRASSQEDVSIQIGEEHHNAAAEKGAQLQNDLFNLTLHKKSICEQYPVFAQSTMDALLTLQQDVNQQQEILETTISSKGKNLYQLQVSQAQREQDVTDFHSWEEEKELLKETYDHLSRRRKALLVAISTLQDCIADYQGKYVEELKNLISGAFGKITDGKYTSVSLEKDTLEPLVSTDTKSNIHKESLSMGAVEQLYFAMRLSMAYLLSQNVSLPFLLDDSFVSYDSKRLSNIAYILSRLKRTNQIILFAHDPFYSAWGDEVIDLNSRNLD
ncbi:MAG: AAA family ATPase [Theionarchaea archaeon]|nr:AAA family ATPase [Theionarchaea archaeon]